MSTSESIKIRQWAKVAVSRGWRVVKSSGGHLKFFRPDGSYATSTPSTPSGGNRSLNNTRAKLRRCGLRDIR